MMILTSHAPWTSGSKSHMLTKELLSVPVQDWLPVKKQKQKKQTKEKALVSMKLKIICYVILNLVWLMFNGL